MGINKKNLDFEIERRRLLKLLGASALSSIIFADRNFSLNSFLSSEARASTPVRKPFVLSIHLGAMDGYSAGLMMPSDVGVYPKGVFFQNEVKNHPNPNVNVHHKTGKLIFNDYTKVLESIAGDMMFCAATPQSLAHEEAARTQSTGNKASGGARSPGWCAGVAQATLGSQAAAYVISDSTRVGSAGSGARSCPNVSEVTATSLTLLKAKFSDSDVMPSAPSTASATEFAAASKALYAQQFNASPPSIGSTRAASSAIDGLMNGIPGFTTVQTSVSAALTRMKVDTRLDAIPDSIAVKRIDAGGRVAANNTAMDPFLEKLRMAALLIETQAASGMSISLGVGAHDFHAGGAAVQTVRTAAQIWAQVAEFWTWVREKGYNNDVLVVVYNEFNRTAANATSVAVNPGTANNVNDVIIAGTGNTRVRAETFMSPGTDHHLSCGMVFLNSKLPSSSRLGAIGDTYVPTGTAGLDGVPSNSLPPYTSLQLFASVVMRVFPGVFPDYRAMRDVWQPLKESDLISQLLT
jgi:hypothetical protein